MPDNQQLLEKYLTQLNSALEKGDLETIDGLLKQDIDLTIDLPLTNSPDHPIITLLNSDKIIDKNELLLKLIEKGAAKIKSEGSNIIHRLIYEIEHKKEFQDNLKNTGYFYEAIDAILKKDKSLLSDLNPSFANPIATAVEFGNLEICEILFKSGADPDSILFGKKDHSLLYEAAEQGNKHMIDLILEKKPKIISGETAVKLFELGKKDHKLLNNFRKIYKKTKTQAKEEYLNESLLRNKIINDEILKTCSSRLLETALSNHREKSSEVSYQAIENFIKNYKDLGLELKSNIIIAAKRRESVLHLIKSGVWLNVQDYYTETALMYAALYGHTGIVKDLIAAGADIDVQYKYGDTALMYAALYGHTEIVKDLIAAGADIDVQYKYGDTALMYAALYGHTEIAKDLIAANADIDVKDNDGKTALMRAALYGHTEIAKDLIAANADIDVKDNHGETALIYAAIRGYTEIAKELVRAGAKVTPKIFRRLDNAAKQLVKDRKKISNKLNEKTDKKLSKAFKEFKETGDFEQAFIDNKLYKHMSMDEKHIKLFEEKAQYVSDKKANFSVSDKIKSVFIGKETVKLSKVIKDLKKEIKKSDDHKILHKAKVARKLDAPKKGRER